MTRTVLTGADQWQDIGEQLLAGKRFGLLTSPTGFNSRFESTIDVCSHLKQAEFAAMFACEHGIRGERQAGLLFEDESDPQTGIKVYSLYGKHRKPTEEMLADIDAIVFDIQDLGVRFYTYLSTLVYTMEACAQYGKSFIVLDRPNPLGGNRIEGGLLEDGYRSMVGAWRIPASTGLTIGEFARLVNGQSDTPCDLHIVPLQNWNRDMEYPDTGLPWLMPSPNIPTMETVRVYTGNCLFEGTNLSEGRGTTKPFEMIGAPWLDSVQLCRTMNGLELPGVRFHPVTFTPMFSKHQGDLCNGVMTFVTDPGTYESAVTALHLLHHTINLHGDRFEWLAPNQPADRSAARYFIDLLSGSDAVRTTVHTAAGLAQIVESWKRDCAGWSELRKPFLIY